MTRYEIGERVTAQRLRIGDLWGEVRIDKIHEHTDNDGYGYVDDLDVTLADGTSFMVGAFEEVVVPHHHCVAVTVARGSGVRLVFTCLGVGGVCRRACARCELLAGRCRCPQPEMRSVACRLVPRCNEKTVAELVVA